jgi:Domain of unknown function (DUF3597)
MTIFGNIVSAIFKSSSAPDAVRAAGAAAAPPSSSPAPGKPMSQDDVEAMIAKIADEQDEDLNWEESIVDLMKLLKLDSSLGARKQLAQELGYTGKLDGSAEMNVWLHEQVMIKLAEGGGKVPESMKRA